MTQSEKVSEQLKKFFSGLGYSQREIAEKLGIRQQVVHSLLNGRPFGKKSAENWSKQFGLNPAWLITGEGRMLLYEDAEPQQTLVQVTAKSVVGELSQTIANEILKLVANGELYPRNMMEQKEQLLREKDAEIKELNREIGALQAQLEQAGLTPVNKKVAV